MKLIIFDFDGTLGDTRRNIVKTMQMTIAELHLPYRSEEECATTIGLPLYGCFETLFPELQKEEAQLNGQQENVCISPAETQEKKNIIQTCADTYRRIFKENLQMLKPQPFPGVIETLSKLSEQGHVLTIASSRSHASLVELTYDMGIAAHISYLIGADDVKEAKPSPEPVLNTLKATNFEASQTLVVGDMAVDILMGANAGAKTCGVTWGNGTREELEQAGADYIINCMEELIEVMK